MTPRRNVSVAGHDRGNVGGQRTVVFTLCLRGSEKVLAAHAIGKDGNPNYMELTQMK